MLIRNMLVMFAVSAIGAIPGGARGDEKDDPHKIPADAKAILEMAENFELLSLEPKTPREVPKESFHGWKVFGKKTIDKAEVQKKLVDAFEKGVAEYKGNGARCFLPRHGIRVKHKGKTADFVICFECSHVRVYVDGEAEKAFLVSDSPAETFNKVLKDAGVELPEQPKRSAEEKRGGESVTGTLEGSLRLQEPVPLNGPFPMLLRKAKVGDRVLLQISYQSRPIFPEKVTAKVSNRAMSALEVITTGNQLFLLKDGEKAEGKAGSHFAVLLKANSSGKCDVTVTCEMSDGSKKDVPFAFEIEK